MTQRKLTATLLTAIFTLFCLPSYAAINEADLFGQWQCQFDAEGIMVTGQATFNQDYTSTTSVSLTMPMPDGPAKIESKISGTWSLSGNILTEKVNPPVFTTDNKTAQQFIEMMQAKEKLPETHRVTIESLTATTLTLSDQGEVISCSR
jgi:hypothetical protein